MSLEVDLGDIVWRPDPHEFERSALLRFMRRVSTALDVPLFSYQDLLEWSIANVGPFWSALADDADIRWHDSPSTVLADSSMPGAVWFPGGTLNYVDLALRRRDDTVAVIYIHESGERVELTWNKLADQVRRAAAGLRRLGIGVGDRVAAYVPSRVETVVGFLAAASLGAIWTATSPDFGEQSVLDRFHQVEPRVLLVVSGYAYNGRWHDRRDVVRRLVAGLPTVEHVVALPGGEPIEEAIGWSDMTASCTDVLAPTPVAFDHPLWIVYTSGTTGQPKPIVHGHGGVMLEHHKLLRFQLDLTKGDRFFWFSTTGWVMWNIVVGGLLVGTPIVLYDGSPAFPDERRLWELPSQTGATFLGLSAAFIHNAMRGDPPLSASGSPVRAVGVTGSPLAASGYTWLLDTLGADTFIASISGGTDVATAFVGCTRALPVRKGRLQTACLGVDAAAVDDVGREVVGLTGELVIRRPMPSMPVRFWGDRDGERYRTSYFDEFPGWWRHGDWVSFDDDGSCVIFGRSDATLNRGGVRMGTADFYSVLDGMNTITDALVLDTTSTQMPTGRLVLVLQPAEGVDPGDLEARVRHTLRTTLSPRHNPDDVVFVTRLAHTLNGKRLEVPAKRLFLGAPIHEVVDPSAVDDPDALGLLVEAARQWRDTLPAQ
jgi:acetoacetyl-CoA synthetase